MRFNYNIIQNKTIFECFPEDLNEYSGKGETTTLSLVSKKVWFNYQLKNPNNDIIAFMCIIIFFPFIKLYFNLKFWFV